MHGLTGGSWKRSGHSATATEKNNPTGNRAVHSGSATYHRITPPRQLSTLLRLADSASTFRNLDGWLRRLPAADPLEALEDHRRQAAQPADTRHLRAQRRRWAGSGKGYWRVAGSGILQVSLPNAYWTHLGLKTLSQTWQRLYQTA
jgi:hypothetical protein